MVICHTIIRLQQHLPLAVCAEGCETAEEQSDDEAHTLQVPERREGKTKVINNCTYRLRYWNNSNCFRISDVEGYMLQQHLPLAVLKPQSIDTLQHQKLNMLQQHLPLAVLKLVRNFSNKIESFRWLQQHLPPAVCAEGCETAEEQSDDEVRTSQVPERREGKTKMMKQ